MSHASFSSAERPEGSGRTSPNQLVDFRWDRAGKVRVDADQSRRRLYRHQVHDDPAPVTACRHVACVAEAIHQHRPGACDALGAPAGRGWLSRVSVARHRRDHDMECVRCGSAVRCRIGQRLDDLELLDDRAGPAVRDDDRERVLVFRASMDEVEVQAVDLGDEAGKALNLASHLRQSYSFAQ